MRTNCERFELEEAIRNREKEMAKEDEAQTCEEIEEESEDSNRKAEKGPPS